MNKEQTKTSTNTFLSKAQLLGKKIKKENFILIILKLSLTLMALTWISLVLATSISGGAQYEYLYSTIPKDGYTELAMGVFTKALLVGDWNPLYLIATETGWWFAILVAPLGFMSTIGLVLKYKNMITPSAIKKTVAKGLQFGYVKQIDVEYIHDEIDYNTGIKEREPNEKTLN